MASRDSRQQPQPYARFFEEFQPVTVAMPGAAPALLEKCGRDLCHPLPASLGALLSQQNGGYYRGGLLHLLGANRPLRHDDLVLWNAPETWKAQYRLPDLERYLFFADDPFGNQFGIPLAEAEPKVWRFDAQHGALDPMADTLAEFFDRVLVDEGPWLLGADLLDAYRESGASYDPGRHLSLRLPGLLGGTMDPGNLLPRDPWLNMHITGQIVAQVRPLPPGVAIAEIRIDPESLVVTIEPAVRR